MESEILNNKNSLFLIFNWKLKKVYEKMFYSLTKEFELTQNEIDVLLFLYNNSPLDTARDIARYRAMSKSMISKSVDSLYKRGFLSYETDETDKRCIHLKIKPVAIPIVEKLYEVQKEFFDSLTYNITKEEYKTMETVLNKMYQNIIDQL
ncbi:MarR family winged helix-turn-helix transcriptional regulator [Tissierella creatinophila]|uniref:Transcriptional regulator SlyA n=1 Tax=Tissierella creatinophila DSM 6911 TaxID=1123403 RepID=A0A1U7M3L8_TISCR|nr:MarR family winged helix-turn-helix transcriptional regulator [Tissierella creatinophila]OLS01913.1 transcriptional regulator SlyA [Tissierella creatinophila DSM 6911]